MMRRSNDKLDVAFFGAGSPASSSLALGPWVLTSGYLPFFAKEKMCTVPMRSETVSQIIDR
jgi:hypothetical protein